ncbi:alpha/beta fold hydrolase [Rhodococcus sp. Q]|uniref:esterase/lipase family protein n=1 Tax=Rhodococcus sp. Q TaxID=2502252 RepID=UPI0010F92557|nr:alpha/beta fold hydrolase [Rhodococcus sp. Q]
MIDRLRTVTTGLATVALFALGATLLPATTATAQSSDMGSSGAQASDDVGLAGVNNFECRSAEHPRPVVLVHGTKMTAADSWKPLAAELQRDNYCVFALNYGKGILFDPATFLPKWGYGVAAIENSAKELDTFVETVRTRTQSAQVDIVGHSQGGTVTRQYLRFEGGAARNTIHNLVMLAPSTHGTDFNGLYRTEADAKAARQPIAVQQQIIGSAFLAALNADNKETFPGIEYTVIATTTDRVITQADRDPDLPPLPFLHPAPGTEGSVYNVTVQDRCQIPTLAIRHANNVVDGAPVGMLNHPVPLFLARQALDPTLAGTPPC